VIAEDRVLGGGEPQRHACAAAKQLNLVEDALGGSRVTRVPRAGCTRW
jgi:hypothetical protein